MLSRPTTANGIHEICIRKDTILINITLKHGGRRISLVTKTSYLYSKPKKFNAEEWVELFKKAGAKYVVPVAEHHDGFSMYDSDLNEWNAVKMGPKKDIIGLLKKAIERKGLVFGLSTHRAENAWFFNGGMNFPSDVQDTTITLYGRRYDNEKYTEDVAREWLTHTYELVDKYQPKLIWFDWSVNNPVLMPYLINSWLTITTVH